MELNNTSGIAKLALVFLAMLLFAIWLAYDASAAIDPDTLTNFNFANSSVSGSLLINRVSGAPNATINGATTGITGIIDQAFSFDGTNDYLNTTHDIPQAGTTNFTINFWINTTDTSTDQVMSTRIGTSVGILFQLNKDGNNGNQNGNIKFFGQDSGSSDHYAPTSNPNINDGSWHMITVVRNTSDPDGGAYYIDGSAKATTGSILTTDIIDTTKLNIASGDGSAFVNADIDEFTIINRSITSSEVSTLYNGGAGKTYPFDAAATTDIDFTAVDDFNGTSINSFSVNISWVNGSVTQHSTTNGTVSLVNISYVTDTQINVTYWNVTNYFNQTILNTTINANTSNSVQASMFQAVATLSAREKITNNSLTGVTFYIGSKNGTVFNLTAGTHTVIAEKAGYYNLTSSITVAALSNTSYSIEGMYNSILNFTAYNAITNASVSNFTVSLDIGETISTTNGTVHFNLINNTNYTYNMTGSTIASVLNQTVYVNLSSQNENVSTFAFNSIRINIFNESNKQLLTQLVTLNRISDSLNITITNTTSTGFINLNFLEPLEYEIRFESSGFNPRSIFLTVTNDSTQNVTVYMTENTTTELQVIEVLDTANQPVESAIVWLQKEQLNSTTRWLTIQEAETDYAGQTTVFVERDVTVYYRFAVIFNGTARPIQPSGNTFTGKTSFIPGVTETIQLIVDLEDDPVDFISDDLAINVNCNLTNNITARCSIVDGRNSITGAVMRIEASYTNQSLSYESIANVSFTGSSGVLEYNLTPLNHSIWRIETYVTFQNSEEIVWEKVVRFGTDLIIEKNTGLLYAVFILAVVAALTVTLGPLPSGLFTFGALIPLIYLKIIYWPIGVVTGLLCLVVIFFFRTRKLDE